MSQYIKAERNGIGVKNCVRERDGKNIDNTVKLEKVGYGATVFSKFAI